MHAIRSASRNLRRRTTRRFECAVILPALALGVNVPSSQGGVGDPIATISPDPAIGNQYCSIGLAFDGSLLYFNRCSEPNIYALDPQHVTDPSRPLLVRTFDTGIEQWPAAMSYDSNRDGLWIGTQKSEAGPGLGVCGGGNMPIYFWDLDDDSVTLMFTIPLDLSNPATGQRFMRFCHLDGLLYDPTRDEIWCSDTVNRNIGVFRPDGTFVQGFDATTVDVNLPSDINLANSTGMQLAANKLYLADDGGSHVVRCDLQAGGLPGVLPAGALFTNGIHWLADMACDPNTFAPMQVMWVRTSLNCVPPCDPRKNPECNPGSCKPLDDIITAYEIEPGGCGAGPPIGACCDPSDPPCRDVPQSSCGGQWFQDTLCANLDPPCFSSQRIMMLDRTGSMENVLLPDGRTRCQAARDQASAEVASFFATRPAGSSVAVWTFRGSGALPLTNGFVGETGATTALDSLIGVPCSDLTPLADAVCAAVDVIVAEFEDEPYQLREISIISDGLENNSNGICAGPPSTAGNSCVVVDPDDPEHQLFDVGSWQRKVCDHMIGNGVANTTFWGELSEGRVRSSDLDSETGLLLAGGVPDEVFFQALAEGSGGRYTFIDSTPPPPTGTPPFGVTGACCLPDATCQESITEAECAVLNGTHQGEASVCTDAAGACCLPDGSCQDAVTQSACTGQGGTFQGACTTCASHVVGACCLPNETCQDGMTPSDCAAQNGTHQGGCTVCTGQPGECPAPIPAVSEWGIVVLGLLALVAGTIILGQRARWSSQRQ